MTSELKEWYKLTTENEDNELSRKIDWKSEMNKSTSNVHPPINRLKETFENIYASDDNSLKQNVNALSSNIYIPILDDPITITEVNEGIRKCKIGGYYYLISTTKNFIVHFKSIIVLLLNAVFYGYYPITLVCSFYCLAYPKKEPSFT